jgi:hypothetical protein
MRYLFLIYLDQHAAEARSDGERAAAIASHTPYIEMLQRNGRYLGSARLGPPQSSRILRTTSGKAIVTAGPFAESREQLGGFYLVDAKDLDQAIADASECPALNTVATGIEIRPIARGEDRSLAAPSSAPLFLLGIYETRAQAEDDPARDAVAGPWESYLDRLRREGHLSSAALLAPAGSATSIRLRDGKVVLADGPFAESREWLRGYCVLQAPGIDHAVELASQCPAALEHAIEVRGIAP